MIMGSNTIPLPGAHYISLETAIDMTTLYRDEKETILATAYQSQGILPFSETFNKAAFEKLLETTDIAAIRLYYGMDENLKVHAIFVAVNDENEDILPEESGPEMLLGDDTPILEQGQRCPTICPPDSVLNG
jgi:hypothetical protein